MTGALQNRRNRLSSGSTPAGRSSEPDWALLLLRIPRTVGAGRGSQEVDRCDRRKSGKEGSPQVANGKSCGGEWGRPEGQQASAHLLLFPLIFLSGTVGLLGQYLLASFYPVRFSRFANRSCILYFSVFSRPTCGKAFSAQYCDCIIFYSLFAFRVELSSSRIPWDLGCRRCSRKNLLLPK